MAANEKSFLCRACQFKFYLNAAAAGIAVIFNKKKELLVTRRKFHPAKDTLDLPGGFAEPGETMEGCIVREIKEELNLNIERLDYFCSIPNTYAYKGVTYPITDMAFFCVVGDFTGIRASDDISHFYFMDPARLDRQRFGLDSARRIIDRLQNQIPRATTE